jgi:diaminopimelate epimerase
MCATSASGPLALTKHHGLSNDFLVALEPVRHLSGADARRWCDRRTGVGADGLVVARRAGAAADSRWTMELFNADGGPAEISGNGIRCLAQAIADHLGHDRRTDLDLDIESAGRVRRCTVLARPGRSGDSDQRHLDGEPDLDRVRVAMGKALEGPDPSARFAEVGVSPLRQLGVDVGNPHIVAFVDQFPEADIAEIGPVVEADYPGGCNVHLVRVDGDRLVMQIWERGVGVTQACGSGATAAAWAAVQVGLVDGATSLLTVEMPGGSAQVEVGGDELVLIGPTVRVAGIEIT